MTITQEDIINKIADTEDIDVATVRKVFKATEKNIFDHLSSTTPETNVAIKIFKGLTLNSKFIPSKTIHTFDEIECQPRIWSKAKISRYYNRQLNFSNKQKD